MLSRANGDTRGLRRLPLRQFPFLYQIPCVLILKILLVLLLLNPKREMTLTGTKNKSLRKDTHRTHPHLTYRLYCKNVVIISLHLKVVPYRPNHEQLTPVSTYQYFCFVEPGMCSEVSAFG